jgi:seryl-tRNA synthetase
MTIRYDMHEFYAGLVDHGLLIPTGVQGAAGRGAVFEDIVEAFNGLVTRVSRPENPESMAFPPVINRSILERVHYLESFPHLCGAVYSFFGNEQESRQLAQTANKGEDWSGMLRMTDLTLSPAACYPVYPSISGTVSARGRLISVMNWVYRHEPSPEPTRMQSFRMRELVRIGTADQVVEWRDAWVDRSLSLLLSLGLAAKTDVASDPFFGRGGKVLARNQKEQRLKFEILVPVISAENPTAVCSFNFHQEHFGSTFGIRTDQGGTANSACLGFGLERVTMALLKTHGFDPLTWPREVRDLLWPK